MHLDRQVAAEIARRAARRLELLAAEQPELLADRLSGWDSEELRHLLELTRLPEPLADREPPRRHVGVRGIDHCTERLVSREADRERGPHSLEYVSADLPELDDGDLVAARRYLPETLPGNVLG